MTQGLLALILALSVGQAGQGVNQQHYFHLEQSKLGGQDMLAPGDFTLGQSKLGGSDVLAPSENAPAGVWDESKWDECQVGRC